MTTEQAPATPEPWPDWLEGLTPDDQASAITEAVANCYEDEGCGGSSPEHAAPLADSDRHLSWRQAVTLLRRLLAEARQQAEAEAARYCERALEAEQAVIIRRHNLRERIDAALGESLYSCPRCKVCDAQMDAIMAVLAAEAGPVPSAAGHAYLSTACLHASEPGREHLHRYCGSPEGFNAGGQTRAKVPGRCKFCNAPCTCPCGHESPVSRESGDQDHREPETAP